MFMKKNFTRLFLSFLFVGCRFIYAQSVPTPSHVVIVVLENHGYSQIIGSPSAPYINSLATDTDGALFTQSFGVEHPSQPNYLDVFSGSNQSVILDFTPFSFLLPFTTANLGAELLQHSRTFTGYSEDLPSVGYTGDNSGQYYRKHNPWVNWQGTGTNGIPSSLNQPFTSFPSNYNNLPTVSFVIPNQDHDMHDGTIAQADTWLQSNIDGYVQWAKQNNSLLILTFDEDDNGSNNQIATIFVGQMVKLGQYPEHITHYNVLRTVEDMYGLPYAGSSSTATPITDCWVFRPHSLMNASPVSICPGQSVSITDMSTNVPTRWNWTFSGASPAISFSQNQQVTYDSAGIYDVTLITSNHMGIDTLRMPGYITVHPIPSVSASANPLAICAGDTVTISATGASVYSWLPASNVVSTNGNVLRATPSADAVYRVLGSEFGCVSDTAYVAVSVSPLAIPTVAIAADTSAEVCAGTTVMFTATATDQGSAPTYQWKVNGSIAGNNSSVLNTFALSSFSVQCILTGNASCASTVPVLSNILSITVNSLPVINASPSSQTICEGTAATLTASGAATLLWSPSSFLDTINGSTVIAYPLADISYTVTGIDSHGCTAQSSALHVIVNPAPQPVITANAASLSCSQATSYQWYLNGQAIAGATAQDYLADTSGVYYAEVFDAQGCSGISNSVTVTVSVSSVRDVHDSPSLFIYPNPNRGEFSICMDEAAKGVWNLSLRDLTCRIVFQHSLYLTTPTEQIAINAGVLQRGVYLLTLIQNGQEKKAKLLVE
jgi:PKD repeat protein